MLASRMAPGQANAVPTAEEGAKAEAWLERHLAAGRWIANADPAEFTHRTELRVGALAAVPGTKPLRLRVVEALTSTELCIWEFDERRDFIHQRIGVRRG